MPSRATMPALRSEKNHPEIWSRPSTIKSAGHQYCVSCLFLGCPRHAYDAAPESYHPTMTSGMRFISPPHLHRSFTKSTHGMCRLAISALPSIEFLMSSSFEPITVCVLHAPHTQTGSGVPQNL